MSTTTAVDLDEIFNTLDEPTREDLQKVLKGSAAQHKGRGGQMNADLERFFRDLDPLIDASKPGMPAARETLEGAKPLLDRMHPFLGQLNPMLQYLETSQMQVSNFISYGAAALADTTAAPGGGVGHYLRQFGPTGAESAAIYPRRLRTNRGQTYVARSTCSGPRR